MRKTIAGVLTSVIVLTSGLTALAGPSDINKDVFNGMTDENDTDSISDMYTTGEISGSYNTIIVTKTHELDGTDLTNPNLLTYKDVPERTVYVDQSTTAYSTALEVIFNQELDPGYYKATMGTVSGTSTDTVFFVVGDFDVDPADKLAVESEAEAYGVDKTNGNTYYKKAFQKKLTIEEYNSFNSIKLISADGTKCIGAIGLRGSYTSKDTHGYSWDTTNLTGEGDITIALQVYAIPAEYTGFNVYFSVAPVEVQ